MAEVYDLGMDGVKTTMFAGYEHVIYTIDPAAFRTGR